MRMVYTEYNTLSLHDALPISMKSRQAGRRLGGRRPAGARCEPGRSGGSTGGHRPRQPSGRLGPCPVSRSEEHTSELQSHVNLVCRLLLEKKKSEGRIKLHYDK